MTTRTSIRSVVAGLLACLAAGCSTCGPEGCRPLVCVETCCYCRRIDDLHTALVARRCACVALDGCGYTSCDYRDGFTQAYIDIAHGKTGALPPVPPQRYWSVCFRSPCGDSRAADWYAGYRNGVESARAWCGQTCHRIPSSGTPYYNGPPRSHDDFQGGDSACGAAGGFPGGSVWY